MLSYWVGIIQDEACNIMTSQKHYGVGFLDI